MLNRLQTLTALGALLLVGSTHAASLSLVYTGNADVTDDGVILALPGEVITLDLVMDFSGPGEGILGGGFDINWDADAFDFVDYASAGLGEPSFARDPDVEPGRLFSGAFGAFGGLSGPDLVATITFQVNNPAPGLYTFLPSGTTGIGGPFISSEDFVTPIVPDYVGVGVYIMPIPAAAWLFGSGLLALIGLRRRGAQGSPTAG